MKSPVDKENWIWRRKVQKQIYIDSIKFYWRFNWIYEGFDCKKNWLKKLKTLIKNIAKKIIKQKIYILFSCIRPSLSKIKKKSSHYIFIQQKKIFFSMHFGFNNQFIKVTRTRPKFQKFQKTYFVFF
jgi:hypothetical protein